MRRARLVPLFIHSLTRRATPIVMRLMLTAQPSSVNRLHHRLRRTRPSPYPARPGLYTTATTPFSSLLYPRGARRSTRPHRPVSARRSLALRRRFPSAAPSSAATSPSRPPQSTPDAVDDVDGRPPRSAPARRRRGARSTTSPAIKYVDAPPPVCRHGGLDDSDDTRTPPSRVSCRRARETTHDSSPSFFTSDHRYHFTIDGSDNDEQRRLDSAPPPHGFASASVRVECIHQRGRQSQFTFERSISMP